MSAINIGLKDLAIIGVRLGDKISIHSNQVSASVDIQVHGDWEFPFGSRKSGNKMSVDFRQNADDKIGMNPSRTFSCDNRNRQGYTSHAYTRRQAHERSYEVHG